jgi:diguanylate cyclase (GGDEF)-like protein/PAS domain S-box-containing protein
MNARVIYQSAAFILCLVVLLALAWRFGLEEIVDPLFFGPHGVSETAEDWEFVIVTAFLVSLAMIGPVGFAVHVLNERDRAAEQEKLAAAIIDNTSEGVMVTDADNRIVLVNPAFTEISGYPTEEVIGRTPRLLASGRHDAAFYGAMWQSLMRTGRWAGEIWNRRKNGEIYAQWLSIAAIRDHLGRINKYVAILRDITESKRNEERLQVRAYTDPLTGLANRTLFLDRLGQAIAAAERRHGGVAVFACNLDRFRMVNETLGHTAGDRLLRETAERLKVCVRDEDTVARLGADHFAVLLVQPAGGAELAATAERLVQTVAGAYELPLGHATVGLSVGMAVFPDHGKTPDALLKTAEAAMYAAKQAGGNTSRICHPATAAAEE